ncbi:MAG: hypothetical protein AAB516_01160 [Patescibacteria group bacterium]
MEQDILKIIEYGIMAPSVDNNQPWYFKTDKKSIYVYLDEDRKKTGEFLHTENALDLICLGALLENIKIASSHLGYLPEIINFPDKKYKNLIARVNLSINKKKASHPFYLFIPQRATNRTRYQNCRINETIKNTTLDIAKQNNANLYWVDDRASIKKIANAASLFDFVLWNNNEKRNDLLKWLRLDEKEAYLTKDGLFLETLGLNKFKKILFNFFAKISRTSILARWIIGINSCFHQRGLIKASSAVLILTMPNASDIDYLKGGQILQNIWLYLTSEKIACQPIAGALYLLMYEFFPEKMGELRPWHRKIAKKCFREFSLNSKISENNALICLLRIGCAEIPKIKSLRRPIKEVISPLKK